MSSENTSHVSYEKPVVCFVGPTATGKSDVAQDIASKMDGCVVSADSMQIYRGMDIGTAKIPQSERLVEHYGLDLVDPGTPYSAALYQAYARKTFKELASQETYSIVCGGTGFYIRAAIDDYDFPEGEQINNPLRDYYKRIAQTQGTDHVWNILYEKDKESAEVVHPHDVKRVIRALELNSQGKSYADQLSKLSHIPQRIPAVFIGLSVDPDLLKGRIDTRVDVMRESGLVDEVTVLLHKGFRDGLTAPQAIGYKEIIAAFDGESTLDEAFDEIKQNTKRYAKRQRTWFRKDKRIHWINANDNNKERIEEEAWNIIENSCLF